VLDRRPGTGDSSEVEHDAPAGPGWRAFLADLPARLAGAVGGDELRDAVAPGVPGLTASLETHSLWIGSRRLPSTLPRVQFELESPIDVRWLSEMWQIEAPVAVSGDAHQRRWRLMISGAELPDPSGRRIAAVPVTAGRWEIDAVLARRPPGPLPGVVSGASPAYDILATGGHVVSVSVERSWVATDVVAGRDATSQDLAVGRDDVALAVAGFRVANGALIAHSFSVTPDAASCHAGSALIDALEVIALANGADEVRLDRSVVAVHEAVPFERHGYQRVGGDDEVVAERPLVLPA
jgi:hypothetical protein